jgi:hypothetical protein
MDKPRSAENSVILKIMGRRRRVLVNQLLLYAIVGILLVSPLLFPCCSLESMVSSTSTLASSDSPSSPSCDDACCTFCMCCHGVLPAKSLPPGLPLYATDLAPGPQPAFPHWSAFLFDRPPRA